MLVIAGAVITRSSCHVQFAPEFELAPLCGLVLPPEDEEEEGICCGEDEDEGSQETAPSGGSLLGGAEPGSSPVSSHQQTVGDG